MFSLTHTYIPSDIPYKLVIILKGVHRQCDSVFFRYFFDHLNYSWRAKKISISFLSFKKFTRNYVVIYDKGSLCTLGFKKCLLCSEVMCTYGGGGGKAGKLHVLVGGVGELHEPVILLL